MTRREGTAAVRRAAQSAAHKAYTKAAAAEEHDGSRPFAATDTDSQQRPAVQDRVFYRSVDGWWRGHGGLERHQRRRP